MMLRRKLAAVVATITLAGGLTLSGAMASSADASAYGCTPYTSFRFHGISPANWCGGPNGAGLRVDNVVATFASSMAGVGYLCNTSMKVEVFNSRGQSVYSAYSPTTGGCFQAGGAFRINVNRTFASEGYIDTTLLSYGAPLATLRHNLKR